MKAYFFFGIILFTFSSLLANMGGRAGFAYLKIGIDARAAAMGEAYSAVTRDASATYWNPAALALSTTNSIVLMHNDWLLDINHEFAAVQLFRGRHNVAFSLNLLHVSGIELRGSRATELAEGETNAINIYFAGSYATQIVSGWNLGFQIKYLYEKYYVEDANGYAFDLGILKDDILPNFSWGLSFQNLGKMGNLRNEHTRIPALVRTGLSYNLPWVLFQNHPLMAMDLLYVFDDITRISFGFETNIFKGIDLRTGYLIGSETYNFTAGFGIRYSNYNIAYAFVPLQNDLGNSHRFSLVINF